MPLIQTTKVQDWRYDIHSLKDGDVEQKFIGTFEDFGNGFFYYCHPNVMEPGHLSARVLKELADELTAINKKANE